MIHGSLLTLSRFLSSGRRSALIALLLLPAALVLVPHARAQSAAGWDKRGQQAELKEDYDTAFEDYLKAHNKSPKDMRYQARLDRMRFQAAAQHVDRGRVLRQNGDIPGALNQFTRALAIDPSNEAAQQEIVITQRSEKMTGTTPTPAQGTAQSSDVLHDIAGIGAPPELKPFSTDLVTLHMASEDVKVIYQAIAKIANLNVIFDPDLGSASGGSSGAHRIPVDLNSVNLTDALRIVAITSKTFYKVLTPDTIFVADNNRTKHTDLDEEAVQTFYLTNASQASDLNDILTTVRNVLTSDDKVLSVPSQNAIVVRAPPEHLLLAEKVLNDLDRTKAEVVVDVAILEVNRDKMRNLGITLPQSFGITPQPTPNASNTTTTTTTTGTNTPLASQFTLNTLGNINATNFGVTIGGGTLNALLSDADTRVLQNPSVRATDGQPATLKIGSRIPYASGSYNAGVATGVASIGVQTQFTYQDVGVTIDMTPNIHLDGEVSLKLDVINSTQAGSSTIEGVTEPIFGTREAKDTIQLHDGEPCLLAGILTKEDNSTLSGTPGLANIPILKYIFGSTNKEVEQDEIVFIIIPHIVRESVLTRLNTRAIDTGTSADIQLRRSDSSALDALFPASAPPSAASSVTAAQAASAMIPQMAQQAVRSMPGVAPGVIPPGSANPTSVGPAQPAVIPPNVAAAAGPLQPVTISIAPGNSTQAVGKDFVATIVLANAHDVFSVPLQLQFDPKVLQLVNVDTGGLLGGDGQPVALVHRDEGNGLVTISASRPPGVGGVTTPQGEVCILHFHAIAAGDSNIALVRFGARNSLGASLPATGAQAVVHVK